MQDAPDVLLRPVFVGSVVNVWERQSGGSLLHRVPAETHDAQSLHHPLRILHFSRSTIDARQQQQEREISDFAVKSSKVRSRTAAGCRWQNGVEANSTCAKCSWGVCSVYLHLSTCAQDEAAAGCCCSPLSSCPAAEGCSGCSAVRLIQDWSTAADRLQNINAHILCPTESAGWLWMLPASFLH